MQNTDKYSVFVNIRKQYMLITIYPLPCNSEQKERSLYCNNITHYYVMGEIICVVT